jgi:hypothetical protein
MTIKKLKNGRKKMQLIIVFSMELFYFYELNLKSNNHQIMKTTLIKMFAAVMIIAVSGLYSCKNREGAKTQKEIPTQEKQSIEQNIEKNVYPLPTSAEVIKKLSDFDLGYIIGLSNPPANVKNYVSGYSRAVNIGIYGADLSYATLYNVQQDVIDNLGAIRNLSNDLNLSKLYDETLYEKIKSQFDNRDTLVTILTDAYTKTYSYMVNGGQENLALLMVGGAWAEGVYLTASVSESGNHLTGFESIMLEQKKSFELFEEAAKPFANDELVKQFLKDVQPIKDVYAKLGSSMTMQNIEDLKSAIATVRATLVK